MNKADSIVKLSKDAGRLKSETTIVFPLFFEETAMALNRKRLVALRLMGNKDYDLSYFYTLAPITGNQPP